MEHFYNNIKGYMVDSNKTLFNCVLDKFNKGSWVELGSWTGKSSAYNVVELINKNAKFKFYCVDTWQGGPEHQDMDIVKKDELYDTFISNVGPIRDRINIIREFSWDAAKHFDNNSIDVCYVDADHQYESVKKDLNAWWPKVKEGGIFCGDDYTKGFPGVQQAVKEFSKQHKLKVRKLGRCWLIEK